MIADIVSHLPLLLKPDATRVVIRPFIPAADEPAGIAVRRSRSTRPGWLSPHGVGAVRNYCIGACLLDKDDPAKVLKRITLPLIQPDAAERFGYVPNVVYSCGALVHGRLLLLPYAVADNVTAFATMPLDGLIGAMAMAVE